MKSIILTAVFAMGLSAVSLAQETETIYSTRSEDRPMKTLVSGEKGFGGHLSLNVKGTEVYDENALLVGGELVFTFGHMLNLGIAGYGMPTRVDYEEDLSSLFTPNHLEFGYGGFFIEPVFFDQSLVHFTVPVLIGGGWAGISDSRYDWDNEDQKYILNDTGFFVVEPGVNMEVNLSRYVKFTIGGTYRMVNGSDLKNVSDSDLSGLSISGGIRVGWF